MANARYLGGARSGRSASDPELLLPLRRASKVVVRAPFGTESRAEPDTDFVEIFVSHGYYGVLFIAMYP